MSRRVKTGTRSAIKQVLEQVEVGGGRLAVHAHLARDLRTKRRMTTHPKFFLFDAGVYRTISPTGPLDSPEEIDGAALETLVFQELRAYIAYRSLDLELFTWRTGAGVEVDFVAYGGDGLFAIEVKRSRRVRSADLQGLTQFKADYPMARCVLLFGGDRREHRDGIDLLPVGDALPDPAIVLE